jgi:hypothetical protein
MALSEDYSDSKVCSYSFTARFSLTCKHFLHDKIHELRADTQDDKVVFITQRSSADQHRWLAPSRATGEVFEGDKAVFRLLDPLYLRAKGKLKGATTKTLPEAKPGKRQRTEPRDPSLLSTLWYLNSHLNLHQSHQTRQPLCSYEDLHASSNIPTSTISDLVRTRRARRLGYSDMLESRGKSKLFTNQDAETIGTYLDSLPFEKKSQSWQD